MATCIERTEDLDRQQRIEAHANRVAAEQRLKQSALPTTDDVSATIGALIGKASAEHPAHFEGWTGEDFRQLHGRALRDAVKQGGLEFRSRSDAAQMSQADINNVQPLTESDRLAIEYRVQNAKWGNWPESDERWTLTPAEWRKMKGQQLTRQKRGRQTATV
jgi:hypothetical protein